MHYKRNCVKAAHYLKVETKKNTKKKPCPVTSTDRDFHFFFLNEYFVRKVYEKDKRLGGSFL